MENDERLSSYVELLQIRQRIYHRNLIIGGAAFSFVLLVTTVILLFTAWNVRTLWLVGLVDILFGFNLVMAWVRFEIVREEIELVRNL